MGAAAAATACTELGAPGQDRVRRRPTAGSAASALGLRRPPRRGRGGPDAGADRSRGRGRGPPPPCTPRSPWRCGCPPSRTAAVPTATGTRTARISSSGASALRFTPRKKSLMSMSRTPRTEAASTTAPVASNGGWASPAGDAVPRLPATVARLRICGEPTVREAIARPGHSRAELVDDAAVRDARARGGSCRCPAATRRVRGWR